MAIPKSTYVMGVLVLGLFGLAIRETAAKKDPPAADQDLAGYDGDDDQDPEHLAAYERAEAARAEERRAEEAAEQRALDTLVDAMRPVYGAEAASPGTLLQGVVIGAAQDTIPEATRDRVRAFGTDTRSDVTFGDLPDGPIDRIEIAPAARGTYEQRDHVCGKLDTMLHDAWGTGVVDERETTTIWVNPATHQRASFGLFDGRCVLQLVRYVTPAEWLDRTPTSLIQLSMIGQPAAKLAAAVKSTVDEDEITWSGPGLGAGTTRTSLVASIVRGKVTAITATASVAESSREALTAHLTAKFGTPKRTETEFDSTELTWNSKPPLSLELGDHDQVVLVVGKR